jgi:TPR repeat protein
MSVDNAHDDQVDVSIAHEAKRLFKQKKYAEAFILYEQLARQDYANCQVFLGWMFAEGVGVAKDSDAALIWFEKAARLGSEEGAFYYGRHLTAKAKHADAVYWYHESARKGYAPALYRLGRAYLKGIGVDRDVARGQDYLEQAIQKGHVHASRELGAYLLSSPNVRHKLGGLKMILRAVVTGLILAFRKPYSDRLKA